MTIKNLQQVRDALVEYQQIQNYDLLPQKAEKILEEYGDTIIATLDSIMGDYVLVPKEPTEEMLEDGYYMDCVDIAKLKRSYKAMIAAAPKHGGDEPQNVEGIRPLCHNVDFGTYQNAVAIKAPWGDLVTIDICMIPEIKWLWDKGIRTTNSCCGHDRTDGFIAVSEDCKKQMDELGYLQDPRAPHCYLSKLSHAKQQPTGDVAEALDELELKFYYEAPYYVSSFKELKISDKTMNTIRRALTQQTSPKGFFSFMGVKICDITDENFDAVNMLNKAVDLMNNPNQPKQKVLGDVEAAIMAVEKWKFMQRAGGYKHEDVLNKAYDVLNNHGLAIRTALGAQQPDVNAELLEALNGVEAMIRQKKGFYAISVGHDPVKIAHKAGVNKGLDVVHEIVKQAITRAEQKGK